MAESIARNLPGLREGHPQDKNKLEGIVEGYEC